MTTTFLQEPLLKTFRNDAEPTPLHFQRQFKIHRGFRFIGGKNNEIGFFNLLHTEQRNPMEEIFL